MSSELTVNILLSSLSKNVKDDNNVPGSIEELQSDLKTMRTVKDYIDAIAVVCRENTITERLHILSIVPRVFHDLE